MNEELCIYENTVLQRLSVSTVKENRDYLLFSVDYDDADNPKLTRDEAIELRNKIIKLLPQKKRRGTKNYDLLSNKKMYRKYL